MSHGWWETLEPVRHCWELDGRPADNALVLGETSGAGAGRRNTERNALVAGSKFRLLLPMYNNNDDGTSSFFFFPALPLAYKTSLTCPGIPKA